MIIECFALLCSVLFGFAFNDLDDRFTQGRGPTNIEKRSHLDELKSNSRLNVQIGVFLYYLFVPGVCVRLDTVYQVFIMNEPNDSPVFFFLDKQRVCIACSPNSILPYCRTVHH